MNGTRRQLAVISSVLVLSLAVVQGSSNRAKLREARSVALSLETVLDERTVPELAASGEAGFISSATEGSVVSFNPATGEILSSFVIGERAGAISFVEARGRSLIAAPAANDPDRGRPATVMILDAANPESLEPLVLVELPDSAHIAPASRALLTADGRFGFIASSFDEPVLFCFSVETGQIVADHPLVGRPSEIALHDAARMLAVVSAASNTLTVLRFDADGLLNHVSSFSPSGGRFEETNNPAFSEDGTTVFAGEASGEALLAIDASTGSLVSRLDIAGVPMRVTAAGRLIAVTRTGQGGGVTLATHQDGRLAFKAEFTPPAQIEFSRANNVVLDAEAGVAFVPSATGILFAFSTETGELQSHQAIGPALLGLTVNRPSRTLAVVRRGRQGDEVISMQFDLEETGEPGADAPRIDILKPDRVEQGRLKPLKLVVRGVNLTPDSALIVDGTQYNSDRRGKVLLARLPSELFNEVRELSVQVKNSAGSSSVMALAVVPPNAPEIDLLMPDEVPGPAGKFTLSVRGRNFRATSIIFVDGQALDTEFVSAARVRARVPQSIGGLIGQHAVQVKDALVARLASSEKQLTIVGPRIDELAASVGPVVAGAGGFRLIITGSNFREGAHVLLDGEATASWRVTRVSGSRIRVLVSRTLTQRARQLEVVVVNPEGSKSDPKSVELHAPSIEGVSPSPLLAGSKDVAVYLNGSFFRGRTRVVITDQTGQTFQAKASKVRFRSAVRVRLFITGKLNDLISRPGAFDIQVVNPNNDEGIPSEKRRIDVAGPLIETASLEAVEGDESRRRLVIVGKHFRRGAEIEFLKDDSVVRRQPPNKSRAERLVALIETRKVEALGIFSIRVVNPGEVKSRVFRIE